MVLKVSTPGPVLGCGPAPEVSQAPGDLGAQANWSPPEGWLEGCSGPRSVLFPVPCRKRPADAKSECQETETKPAPAEVKTGANDATQTKETESKA